MSGMDASKGIDRKLHDLDVLAEQRRELDAQIKAKSDEIATAKLGPMVNCAGCGYSIRQKVECDVCRRQRLLDHFKGAIIVDLERGWEDVSLESLIIQVPNGEDTVPGAHSPYASISPPLVGMHLEADLASWDEPATGITVRSHSTTSRSMTRVAFAVSSPS